tara:strand:- start:367 stop:867 length:501 start_codon:yes stop_codon:yes gene_type:complete
MYTVISIHPSTLHVAHRSFHATHQEAVKAMKSEVTDYITNYKKYQTVIYINNKDEMKNHKDTKYFLKVSNKYPNRISIYERKKVVDVGYIYNGKKTSVEKIKVFYVSELSLDDETKRSVQTDNDLNWVSNIQRNSKQSNLSHGVHVDVIEELKAKLDTRRSKFHYD